MRKIKKTIMAVLLAAVMLLSVLSTALADFGVTKYTGVKLGVWVEDEYVPIDLTVEEPVESPEDSASPASLLPLPAHMYAGTLDLRNYMPAALKNVRLDVIWHGISGNEGKDMPENIKAAWTKCKHRWQLNDVDDYTIYDSNAGIDLSPIIVYGMEDTYYLKLILGEHADDQLDPDNEVYVIRVETSGGVDGQLFDFLYMSEEVKDWMSFEDVSFDCVHIYNVLSCDYNLYLPVSEQAKTYDILYSFKENNTLGASLDSLYIGDYSTAEEAVSSGAKVEDDTFTATVGSEVQLTALLKSEQNPDELDCYYISVYVSNNHVEYSLKSLLDDQEDVSIYQRSRLSTSTTTSGRTITYALTLSDGKKRDGEYSIVLDAIKQVHNKTLSGVSLIEKAYVGEYVEDSSDLPDIKNELFGTGYKADFSGQPIEITVIDTDNCVTNMIFIADEKVTYEISGIYDEFGNPVNGNSLSSSIWDTFYTSFLFETIYMADNYPADGEYALKMTATASSGDDAVQYAAVGCYDTIEDLKKQKDIKDELFGNGYVADYSNRVDFTILDINGDLTIATVETMLDLSHSVSGIYDENQNPVGTYTRSVNNRYVFELNEGLPANGTYYVKMTASSGLEGENGIAGAYLCDSETYYNTDDPKTLTDVKDALFGDKGYGTDFSQGVYITVCEIYGGVYQYYFITQEYTDEAHKSSGTDFEITGVAKTKDGGNYETFNTFVADKKVDEMKNIYQTVLILASPEEIAANSDGNIYPEFTTSSWANVFLGDTGGASKQSSGDPVKFESGKALHYTVQAGNEKAVQNYYVTFIAQGDDGELFVLGENADDNNYKDGVHGREIHLGDLQRDEDYYDILFLNSGKKELENIEVKLIDAKNIALDEYWTVNGANLGGFTSVKPEIPDTGETFGILGNLGKIRLVPLYDENGKIIHGEISGTLVISVGGVEHTRIRLSGVAGTPSISTETIPDAVRYVPYGIVLQQNNVSGQQPTFRLMPGAGIDEVPPMGITAMENGAIYGITPAEPGEYKFTVELVFGSRVVDSKELTLTVLDNTDDNVMGAAGTDEGYDVLQYVGVERGGDVKYTITRKGDQVFRSEGAYSEFVAFYLDGQMLTEGEDYKSEEGSTVITIFDETIRGTDDGNKHTIAAEYRTDGTDVGEAPSDNIKRAAQNYVVDFKKSGGGIIPASPTNPGNTQKPEDKDPSSSNEADGMPFTDVKEGDWDYDEVKWAYSRKWMVGISDTKFDPDSPVSQSIIVTVLARMQGVDLTKYDGVTEDGVPAGQWYTNAAIWAKKAGLLPDGIFTADAPTPRGQMAITLAKYLRSMGFDVSAPDTPYVFKDADSMTEAEQEAFQALYKMVIFKGIGDMRMAPQSNTSRSEFATLIHRIADLIESKK